MKDHGAHEEVDKKESTLKTPDGIVAAERGLPPRAYMPSDLLSGFLLNSSNAIG
jgi:hypothetical protein